MAKERQKNKRKRFKMDKKEFTSTKWREKKMMNKKEILIMVYSDIVIYACMY